MKLLLILLAQIPLWLSAQNPLKNALATVGNTQTVHYSKSGYNFENNYSQTIFIGDVNDNRVSNWNKQLNDTIRIEPIRDYWTFPYKFIFKEKISKDLASQKFVIGELKAAADFNVLPTVEIHFPNFVNFPNQGYWVLTKVSFDIEKKNAVKLQKAYEDYYFFGKGHPEYKPEYNTNMKEGTNVAMWVGMKRVLDKFYKDLDYVLVDKEVAKDTTPMRVYSIASNIDKDLAIVKSQKSYSEVDEKDKFKSTKDKNPKDEYNMESSYKMDSVKELAPPVDSKLVNAIAAIPIKKDTPVTVSKIKTSVKKVVNKIDSSKIIATKERENKIDSVLIKKELEAKIAKEKKEKEKIASVELAKIQQAKMDSLKLITTALQNEKIKAKLVADSIKKIETNKAMEIAKKKKEEERQKQELIAKAKAERIVSNKISDSIKNSTKKTLVPNTIPQKRNETLAEAMRRIAAEVEEEERRTNPPKVKEPISKNTAQEAASKKPETVKAPELSIKKSNKEVAPLEPKPSKEIATLPIIPVNYTEDSIKLEKEKQKKREAIIAAQRAAFEAEKNAVFKDPDAGKLFPTVITDPPSKMPDSRSFEQRKADRIFTPKNTVSRDLLDRVKLITPEEEAKILAKLNSQDKASIDSVFIVEQANKPKSTPIEKPIVEPLKKIDTAKTIVDSSKIKSVSKTVSTKKEDLINKGLQKAAELSKTTTSTKTTIQKVIDTVQPKSGTPSLKATPKTAVSIKKEIDTNSIKMAPVKKETELKTKTSVPVKKEIDTKSKKIDSTIDNKINELNKKVINKVGK